MASISHITVPDGSVLNLRDKEALRAASAAPEFSPATQYYAGDICSYEGKVYSAKQSHLGAWNSGHFLERDPLQAQIDAIRGYEFSSLGSVSGATLKDRAVNSVEVAESATLMLPPARQDGMARNFYVRLDVVQPGSQVTFSASGEYVAWDCSGVDPSSDYDACAYLLQFVEIEPGLFHVVDLSAVTRIERALRSGPHVYNPSTGRWHRLIAQSNPQGLVSIGVEQAGVSSWPGCQCDGSSDSAFDEPVYDVVINS